VLMLWSPRVNFLFHMLVGGQPPFAENNEYDSDAPACFSCKKKKRIVRQADSHHSALLRLSLSNAPGLRQFGRLKNGLLQYKSQTYNFFFSGFISWYL
jgi:hypothetical protein